MHPALRVCSSLALCVVLCQGLSAQEELPVRDPAVGGMKRRPETYPYQITYAAFQPAALCSADPAGNGIIFDLHDSLLYGRLHAGPAFFDETRSDYFEVRFRQTVDITAGKAVLPVKPYFEEGNTMNANGWTDRGAIGYRLELVKSGKDRPSILGVYDSRVWFMKREGRVRPVVSIIEGPNVNLITSDHPEWIVVACAIDRPARVTVDLHGGRSFSSDSVGLRHEIRLTGLLPGKRYSYRVQASDGPDTAATPWISFTTAPVRGSTGVTFVYAGDARQAYGGSEFGYMGVNRRVLGNLVQGAFRKGADFLLFGGDLINGHLNHIDAFRTQVKAFKRSIEPFRFSTPLYSAMGNHETLIHTFDDGSRYGLGMDRWPYATESVEAVFGSEFVQPLNGPLPRAGFPPYAETAFAMQYGDVRVIVFNNNYWWTSHNRIPALGGSPEGYILPEQLAWIEQEIRKAENDPTVRYTVLLAHEPVFPGGGHLGDAMWHDGDNTVRAYAVDGAALVPFEKGIVDVRNRLWELVSGARKVAAVLGSDEHNYQRMLIAPSTPVGVPSLDDKDGDGKLRDGSLSPHPGFKRATWFIVSGGAGAPYYTQQPAPWSSAVKAFTPQAHYVVFRTERNSMSLQVFNESGQLLDEVRDLMAIRR